MTSMLAILVAALALATAVPQAYLTDSRLWGAVLAVVLANCVRTVLAWRSIRNQLDSETLHLMEERSFEDALHDAPECLPVVRALETADVVHEERECAAQMRDIVSQQHLKYSALVEDPERLLRCSVGMFGSNGALWTRFTVQYNLYAGSIVCMGTDEQREQLYAMQKQGSLGCFAFTEKGAGVLSGAGVETTADYDKKTDTFVIHSPTKGSTKNWISQGYYAELAIILAELFVDGQSMGPHLFWARIADRDAHDVIVPYDEVTVGTNPKKTTMLGLDNATISFQNFRIPKTALLSRYSKFEEGVYQSHLPEGCTRMLDLLLSRLLTGRIQLSEATLAHGMSRLRSSWKYTTERELWRGKKPHGRLMSEMPLIQTTFAEYAKTTAILQHFVEHTRKQVAEAIRNQAFTDDIVEATCMSKYLGTSFGIDLCSVLRKTLAARGIQEDSKLGNESFLPNATAAAEGDNTVMELKVVQDIVRGRTSKVPMSLIMEVGGTPQGRSAARSYLFLFFRAMVMGKKAIKLTRKKWSNSTICYKITTRNS